jgi:putative tricarboxylic transport membrane protein
MSIFDIDYASIFNLVNLLAILGGSLIGLVFGAIPGLGALITIVLMLPVSFMLDPLPAILLLLSIYQSAEYGGSISSIVLGIPGTPSNVATVLDGHPLAQKKSPGKALAYSLASSTFGGLFGGLILLFLAAPVAKFALTLSYPEYFLVAVLGIFAVAAISSKNMLKSVVSAFLGLMAGTVGIDGITGTARFTGGSLELMGGLNMIPVILGMFAFSEIAIMISETLGKKESTEPLSMSTRLSMKEQAAVAKPSVAGATVGSLVGIFPGTGSSTASWFGYGLAQRLSRSPRTFGTGNPEGIAGAESANNSAVGGAILPMLTLGVPGSPTIAVIMGAFIMHGIVPGPNIFSDEPKLAGGILFGFLLTSIAMFCAGKLFTPVFARVLAVPPAILIPIVVILSLIGAYTANYLHFEVWLGVGIGLFAYFMRRLDFSLPAFILAFVLSEIIEKNFRRAITVSGGDWSIFISTPVALVLVLLVTGIVVYGVFSSLRSRKAKVLSEEQEDTIHP